MGTVELKARIQTFLDKADNRISNIVHGVFENYYQDDQFAFHPDGSPMMSRKEYKRALDTAENQIREEDFMDVVIIPPSFRQVLL